MWFDKLTTLRKLEGHMISLIDQPDVIWKILEHLDLREESLLLPAHLILSYPARSGEVQPCVS